MGFDLFEDVVFGVCWRANDNDISVTHYVFGIARYRMELTLEVALVLPRRSLGICRDLILPNLWSSRQETNLKLRIVVSNGRNARVSKVSSAADSYFVYGLHFLI